MPFKTTINFTSAEELLESFAKLKVLIVGDVMIDSYLWGKVERISPEAPVPIVHVQSRDKRLGGAANVALNIQALGASPFLCSVIGLDNDGDDFLKLLSDQGISPMGIVRSENRVTTIKHRIISGSHQMLRVDSEDDHLLNTRERSDVLAKVEELLPNCDVVIFQDYDKGVLDEVLIKKIVELASSHDIPTIVDPKKRNFLHYHNVSLFKPNRKELKEGLKVDWDLQEIENIQQSISLLKNKIGPETVLITLSEKGVYIDNKTGHAHVPAHRREICDVSGAGDTVISVAALAYALNCSPKLIAELSNLAGGIVCEQVGVVPIQKATFLKEIKRLNLI